MKGKDLKKRINGANETVKITNAMQLIAVSKMNKLQAKLESSREFLRGMKQILEYCDKTRSKLTEKRDGNRTTFIIVTGDKGLCGDYNHAVLDYADAELKKYNVNAIYPIGQYCRDHYKAEKTLKTAYVYMMQEPFTGDAIEITEDIVKSYLDGKSDEVYIIYTAVPKGSLTQQEVVTRKILPLELEDEPKDGEALVKPSQTDKILQQYIWSRIYFALCSASLALNYKRMIAMQSATTNGKKLADNLQAQYNHARQENITTELIDASISKQGKRL